MKKRKGRSEIHRLIAQQKAIKAEDDAHSKTRIFATAYTDPDELRWYKEKVAHRMRQKGYKNGKATRQQALL